MGDDEMTGASRGTPFKGRSKGTDAGVGMMGFGPQSFLTLGAASKVGHCPSAHRPTRPSTDASLHPSKVDLVADFRSCQQDRAKQGSATSEGGPPQPTAKVQLPEGVQLLGGEAILEEQEDGSQASCCTAHPHAAQTPRDAPHRLSEHITEAASLQPHVPEVAAPCLVGCNPPCCRPHAPPVPEPATPRPATPRT